MDVAELTAKLIAYPSVTPDGDVLTQFIAPLLNEWGFNCARIERGGVENLWAEMGDLTKPVLVFNGHCDVVPPGDLSQWTTPPFEATRVGGFLYGRGASDMKGPLAALILAARQIQLSGEELPFRLALAITADEEGPAKDGTVAILDWAEREGKQILGALVGEPTSVSHCGDTVKVGRRGSLTARIAVHGKQGHVAYPHLGINAVHESLAALTQISQLKWDDSDDLFPATSLQIANLNAGTGATNVIPGTLRCDINVRHTPATSPEVIKAEIENCLKTVKVPYDVEWIDGANAFRTDESSLSRCLLEVVEKVTGVEPRPDAGGGTSDARFFAARNIPVAEFGPLNATIHQIDECVSIADLRTCQTVYEEFVRAIAKSLTSR